MNLSVGILDTSCEVLSKANSLLFLDTLTNYQLIIENVLTFLRYVEENGVDTLIYMKKIWYNNFSNRDDFCLAMLLIEYFYYDLIKNKSGLVDYFFSDKIDDIKNISRLNSIDSLVKKIEIINYAGEMARCNLNLNLLIDDVVIRLGECNE